LHVWSLSGRLAKDLLHRFHLDQTFDCPITAIHPGEHLAKESKELGISAG
jgi:hypothetical protein